MKRKAHRLAREFLWACSNPKSVPDTDPKIRGGGGPGIKTLRKGGGGLHKHFLGPSGLSLV